MEEEKLLLAYSVNLQLFADEGAGGEKTEEATAKHLSDARNEGNVAKSMEIISAAMLLALFVTIKVFSGYFAKMLMEVFPYFYGTISVYSVEKPSVGFPVAILKESYLRVLIITLPVLIIAFFVAFAMNAFQVKFKATAKPLKPKLSKLDPIKGFKKIFSKDKIVDLIKAICKIVLIFAIAYSTLKNDVDKIKILYDLELFSAIKLITDTVINMGIKMCLLYMLIGLFDYIYHKIKFKKDMRMSKQEVKDEFKQTEGDPQVKSRIKSKMREVSMKRMMQKLPEADVVITNPTHFACAIKYDNTKSKAPVLIAKGADYLAQKIKDVAKEHDIPIVENKPLARMLYHNVDLDSEIPEELYKMTAEVLAYVYQLKGKK